MNIISGNEIMKSVRASDLVLDRTYNPANSPDVETLNSEYLAESCGLIPDFFADACLMLELDSATIDFKNTKSTELDTIAETMNTIYGSGGFYNDFGGSIDEDGCYVSKYSEEEPMPPFAKFIYENFCCYVYDCAITVLFDLRTRQTIVGRFD
tara:strand:+ start:274 stop:732 length:459 start_codon:yes stop_codon:yes gene_type:complete